MGIFWPFFGQKQLKFTKNDENLQNQNRLMKFSEIWYVVAPQQKNASNNLFFYFGLFQPLFNQKTAKIDQK